MYDAKVNNIPFQAIDPLNNTYSLSADSILFGNSVTVKCSADGGEAPYTYAVYYRKAGITKWTIAQGYKTNAAVKITPKAAVKYEVRVAVKDSDGNIDRKDMQITVVQPFVSSSYRYNAAKEYLPVPPLADAVNDISSPAITADDMIEELFTRGSNSRGEMVSAFTAPQSRQV